MLNTTFQSITQAGTFTNQTKNIINANFQSIQQVDVWVRPQYGNNNGNGSVVNALGSWANPYATMAGVSSRIQPGIVIGLEGVLKEEFSMPNVADVTFVGAASNQPRQATTGGVANGGGATWTSSSASASTPMLTVNGQGTRIQNIFFASGAGVTANPCVLLTNAGDPPTSACSEHTQILGCKFTGTDDGIKATGLPNFITIDGCTFFNFVGAGDTAIASETGLGTGTLLGWVVTNNTFYNNVNGCVVPGQNGFYIGNTFVLVGASVTATTLLSLTGGTGNTIYNNKFGLDSNAAGVGTIVAMGTTPNAGPNFYNEQTEYGQPS